MDYGLRADDAAVGIRIAIRTSIGRPCVSQLGARLLIVMTRIRLLLGTPSGISASHGANNASLYVGMISRQRSSYCAVLCRKDGLHRILLPRII